MDKILMTGRSRKSRIKFFAVALVGVIAVLALGFNFVSTETTSAPLPIRTPRDTFDFNLPDSNVCKGIRLRLKSGIAIDNETHAVLYCYNANQMMPVASISKLLTAMVVLDNYKPDTVITITKDDSYKSSRSILRAGDQVTVRDLLHAALIRSDNRAARALARSVSPTVDDFAVKMNEKASQLGMDNTVMYEPTGLDERNRSTAADCARLVNSAMKYSEIARITSLKDYSFQPLNRKRARRLVNTNKLLFSQYKILAGKTGYIQESAYCLTTVIENSRGKKLTVVVLGAPGPQSRFSQARKLAIWAFKKLGTS